MSAFLFVSSRLDEYCLPHSLQCLSPRELESLDSSQEPFIVSNVPTQHAYILAPEVNFYLQHTKNADAKNIEILYRAREMSFDNLESDKQLQVPPSLFVLGEGEEASDFCLYANQNGFDSVLLEPSKVLSVQGQLGSFSLLFSDETTRQYGQGVLFVDVLDLLRYKGIESAADFDDAQALLQTLKERVQGFYYHDIIHFDTAHCQYENRREKCCCACAEACPTLGIFNDDEEKKLYFSNIDCVECGVCLSVCPTGSIEFNEFPRELFFNILKLYRDVKILLIDEESFDALDSHSFTFDESILPLVVHQINALNPLYLLSCIQESGCSIAIYKESPTQLLKDSIEIVNTLTQRAYYEQGIYLVDSPTALQQTTERLRGIEGARYFYAHRKTEHNRAIFAERMRYLIKDKNLGHLPSYQHFRYGEIHLKEGCTLCLSCVGACNVGALSANEQNYTLIFNPSLCTTCEYCLLSCPENVMILERNGIPLNETWFNERILAKDEPFKCVECGTAFATTQSISKVYDMLAPKFGNDEQKIRTLLCCPDCKVRIMTKGML
ncbi:hypothetical protein CCZ01_04420 [Helicobacter monodelphidis]|uniref:(4Fe-4S)-binding protein n=1 Tax=Helicobacter sp. 15-1451 TaxID=2004995 RepID=UPI000DCB9C43|nr:(4Fe-4S)-binding protein [Helicobacter sp. 15-1451]RAX57879.1 hypothetical protein CCZ01_04420 [Helicobacter sp. 15-1451]